MITAKIKERKKEVNNFPKLMESMYVKSIVFFEKKGVGICLSHLETEFIGTFASDWDMYHFKDFKGELTLKNK